MEIKIGTITENEAYIISVLRALKPYEKITIHADKLGKPDTFIVNHERKYILTEEGIKVSRA